jgi:hypothetical protein
MNLPPRFQLDELKAQGGAPPYRPTFLIHNHRHHLADKRCFGVF